MLEREGCYYNYIKGQWLDDIIVYAAQHLLRLQYSSVDGLLNTGFIATDRANIIFFEVERFRYCI